MEIWFISIAIPLALLFSILAVVYAFSEGISKPLSVFNMWVHHWFTKNIGLCSDFLVSASSLTVWNHHKNSMLRRICSELADRKCSEQGHDTTKSHPSLGFYKLQIRIKKHKNLLMKSTPWHKVKYITLYAEHSMDLWKLWSNLPRFAHGDPKPSFLAPEEHL